VAVASLGRDANRGSWRWGFEEELDLGGDSQRNWRSMAGWRSCSRLKGPADGRSEDCAGGVLQ
jgi:hypothetical protein